MHKTNHANTQHRIHSSSSYDAFTLNGYNSDGEDSAPGERALWRAVITQTLMDASSNSKKVIDKVERARALAWFSLRNPDFLAVCSLADMEPKYVLQKVKEAISRGCKWRKEPGTAPKKNTKTKKNKASKLLAETPLTSKAAETKSQPPFQLFNLQRCVR